ncbi:MAG: hypothetical protein QJR09_07565 [Micrococcus sp.]|nr:hypothetical protein [Micrococcus sp.]
MSTADPTQSPGATRRSQRQHRRVDSEAGAPAGETSEAILDLPASPVNPADVAPLTGALPGVSELPLLKDGRVVSRPGQSPAALARVFGTGDSPAITVASDGVPLGPDGQPLTRRQLRELRRRQESAVSGAGSSPAVPSPSTARRAEAPAGAPAGVVPEGQRPGDGAAEAGEAVSRESLAREAVALAERLEAAGDDPEAVDPELLREQELLAEKARSFNETGALATVPPAAPAAESETDAETAAETVRHDPVEAQSAHGLDSLSASEWGSRERALVIVAAVVFAVLVVALILALVL